MDFSEVALLLLCFIWPFLHLRSHHRQYPKLPPGPYPIPIIGNLLQLGASPHRSFARLSKTYGPIMHLKLGILPAVVVSSPEIAKEILQKHDNSFPVRWTGASARPLGHNTLSMACLPVCDKWRNLRKVCREQVFSTQRMEATWRLRQDKVRDLVAHCRECCREGRAVDVGEAAFVTSLNLLSNTLFSVDFAGYGSGLSQELKGIVRGLMRVLGRPNVSDYYNMDRWFDPQGIKRESEFYMGKLLEIFDGIIDGRVSGDCDEKKNDLLEALLQNAGHGNDESMSRDDIKHLLLDLFVAGTDTSSSTIEWAMTELLRNPNIMSKAKLELKTVIGQDGEVEESDISKLPYLQAVIKESFRYHPPGPFLARKKRKGDPLEIRNYTIPNNAIIFINLWAIGRDPSVWPKPDSFEPERFQNGETIDVKGQNFELLPFGAGRRICPGMPLAYRMVHLMVASLVHNFDWELEPGVEPEEIDVSEKFGISLQKALPLMAIPRQ